MAIVSAKIRNTRSATTLEGHEEYEVKYIVVTDVHTDVEPLKAQFRAFTSTGPGTTYKGLFGATDISAGWQGDNIEYEDADAGGNVNARIGIVNYTQDPAQVNTVTTDKPWERNARFRQISRVFQASTLTDVNGRQIENSAGDPFDAFTINKQRHHAAIILENDIEGDPNLLALNAFLDKQNDQAFFGLPLRHWLVDDLEVVAKKWVDGTDYYTQRWTFLQAIETEEKDEFGALELNPTWDKRYLNIGFYQRSPTGIIPVTDEAGAASTVMKLLDRNGVQLVEPDPGDTTFTDKVLLFKSTNFSGMNIPVDFPLSSFP